MTSAPLTEPAIDQAAAGRLEEAGPLADEAIEVYAGLGADRDVARVRALFPQLGLRRGSRRRHVRTTSR